MNNVFHKPYIGKITSYFPYDRDILKDWKYFTATVFDGGAYFFANDHFGTTDADVLAQKTMDSSIFDYWRRDGEFDWLNVFKDFRPIGYFSEWEGHIWLQRLYILLPLAHKYMVTGEEKYALKWLEILKDFWAKNPYTRYEDKPVDLVWRDMQVTWRCISIVHSIFMLGDCKVFSKEDWELIYTVVKTHANHLYSECVRHETSDPDNHRLQIATTTIMFATMFPEFFDVDAFVSSAKKVIIVNMNGSIFADGCNNEDSMSYSHFNARLYLEAFLYLRNNGIEGIDGLEDSIKKQYEFLYHFSSPSGKALQLGDSYTLDVYKDIEYVNLYYPLEFSRERRTRLFADSRMAVLKNGEFSLYVDAMDMDEWHQHYGRPHFILFYGEKQIVIDSGSVNYDRGWIRRILNSERGHNVIHSPGIKLTRRPSNESLRVTEFVDGAVKVLEIENTVTGEDKKYVWVRRFELYEDRLEIKDSVETSDELDFVSRIFLPDCRVGYTPEMMPPDTKEEKLRFGSFMERVSTDTLCEIEFTPCVDINNRMNYAECLVRKFNGSFSEKTVIRYDRIRNGEEYFFERLPEFVK